MTNDQSEGTARSVPESADSWNRPRQPESWDTPDSAEWMIDPQRAQSEYDPGALQGFVRGALPPQGLDTFLKELGETFSQVVDMYSNVARLVFQQMADGITPPNAPAGRDQNESSER